MDTLNNMYVFGVDLGGTTTEFGLFRPDGMLVHEEVLPTDTSGQGMRILKNIAEKVIQICSEEGIEKKQILGIGIGVPGPVTDEGIVKKCVNLGWGYLNVKQEMEERSGLFTVVENDANMAALGEVWKGAAEGYRNAVLVTLGTAVGGGVLLDGKLVRGAFCSAGEIGHILVDPQEGEPCSCGNYGCLEQYSSVKGLLRMAEQKGETRFSDVREIYDAAKLGDPSALELTERAADYLGRGLSAVSAVVDPEVFIIGGGISKAGPFLLHQIQNAYVKYAFHASRETKFVLAQLGNNAGIYGAAKKLLDTRTEER